MSAEPMVGANPVYDHLLRGRRLAASDAHLKTGQFPSYRVDRRLRTDANSKVTLDVVRGFLANELTQVHLDQLEAEGYTDVGLDFADNNTGLKALGRLRVNARYAYGRTALNLAVRYHAPRIFTLHEFGIGDYVDKFLLKPHRGLDLIAAPMGMGKTSLRCALLQAFNERFGLTITSYEDPIELLLTPVKASIEQVEISSDVLSFSAGGRALRRTDTDIVSYGEFREGDRDTKRSALSAAKSMNVIGTSHADTAGAAIDDMIEGFPVDEQSEVRSSLAAGLNSVIVLRSLPSARARSTDELKGRQNVVIASEILHVTEGVRSLIRRGETHRIASAQMGADREYGSRTLEAHMAQLAAAGEIDVADPLVAREIKSKSRYDAAVTAIRENGGFRA